MSQIDCRMDSSSKVPAIIADTLPVFLLHASRGTPLKILDNFASHTRPYLRSIFLVLSFLSRRSIFFDFLQAYRRRRRGLLVKQASPVQVRRSRNIHHATVRGVGKLLLMENLKKHHAKQCTKGGFTAQCKPHDYRA